MGGCSSRPVTARAIAMHVRGNLYNFGEYLANPGAVGAGRRVRDWRIGGAGRLVGVRALSGGSVCRGHQPRGRGCLHQDARPDNRDGHHQRCAAGRRALRPVWPGGGCSRTMCPICRASPPPNVLKYKSSAFRSDYPALHASCTAWSTPSGRLRRRSRSTPPGGPGNAINVTGTIYAGSAGTYQRALQEPGGGQFTLLFSEAPAPCCKVSWYRGSTYFGSDESGGQAARRSGGLDDRSLL